jgi:hypothetical protein
MKGKFVLQKPGKWEDGFYNAQILYADGEGEFNSQTFIKGFSKPHSSDNLSIEDIVKLDIEISNEGLDSLESSKMAYRDALIEIYHLAHMYGLKKRADQKKV